MVDQKQQVLNWLKAGAVWKDGVLLFRSIFGKDHPFITLIKKGGSELKYQILKQSLSQYANWLRTENSIVKAKPAPKLRDDFPFLNEPNCPAELKILAADKLTAYYNYTNGHEKFFDCITNDDYLKVAKLVVENYIKNRSILREFDHFKNHNQVLGHHPIFRLWKRVAELKKMKIAELVKLKDKLLHNIWRIKSEIEKYDKPHLFESRMDSIAFKEQEIIEINRILEQHV